MNSLELLGEAQHKGRTHEVAQAMLPTAASVQGAEVSCPHVGACGQDRERRAGTLSSGDMAAFLNKPPGQIQACVH